MLVNKSGAKCALVINTTYTLSDTSPSLSSSAVALANTTAAVIDRRPAFIVNKCCGLLNGHLTTGGTSSKISGLRKLAIIGQQRKIKLQNNGNNFLPWRYSSTSKVFSSSDLDENDTVHSRHCFPMSWDMR